MPPTVSAPAPVADSTAWPLVLIALAWSMIWVQFAIIPFFNRREDLVRNYSTSGLLAAVYSRIESTVVIPALVAIYAAARQQQPDKRVAPDMEALLSETSYVEHIEKIEAAVGEKRSIRDDFDRLRRLPTLIWTLGLAHVLLVIFLAGWNCGACPYRSRPASYVLVTIALLFLTFVIGLVVKFNRIMGRFTSAMDRHKAQSA
jgi:hypothetical protein